MRKFLAKAVQRSAGQSMFNGQIRRQFSYSKVKDFLVKAWKDTYPDEVDAKTKTQQKFADKRKMAAEERVQREKYENMTEEELEELEKHIPEERRRELVFVQSKKAPESFSKRLKRSVYQYLKQSAVSEELKKYNVSVEEFEEELDKLSEGSKTFKENVKSRISDSDSPIVKATKFTMQQMNIGSTGPALDRMKEMHPDFDLFELEDEVIHIFTEVYHEYLKGNLDYVEKVCSGEALGYFQASIKSWEEMQVQPFSKEIWFLHSIDFQRASLVNSFPYFQFLVRMQEVNCLVSTKEEDQEEMVIVSGDKSKIMETSYLLVLTLNREPNLEEVGHEWEIVQFRLAESHKMIL